MFRMFRSLVVFAVCLNGAGVTTLGASSNLANEPAPGDRVFRSGVELVALNVVVTDHRRQFVSDLREQDFVVLEDGVPQSIAFFSGSTVPLDLVILIDTSASMGPKRPVVQQAATGFLRVLRDEDRAAIVGFSEHVTVLQGFTGDASLLEGGIRRAGASGDTALFTSLYVVLREFGRPAQQAHEVRRQAIVVLTDGENNYGALGFEAVLEEARSRGVAVYAIMLQSASVLEREAQDGRLLPARAGIRQIATETGAVAYFPRDVSELDGVYQSIAAELAHQYSIAYLPAATAPGTVLRSVAVRVASKPALRARTRTTYLPTGQALRLASAR